MTKKMVGHPWDSSGGCFRPPSGGSPARLLVVVIQVLLVASGLLAGSMASGADRAQAASAGSLLPPFDVGQRWNVCQGYFSNWTHRDGYGLDLTGAGCDNSAAGRTVRAPLAGSVAYWQGEYGNLCINTDDGRSITLTHIEPWLTSGRVAAGQAVGSVAAPGARGNNNVAHIHLQMWADRGCYKRNNPGIPFDQAHGARICGAPDMTPAGPSAGNGTWSGTSFTGDNCSGSDRDVSDGSFVTHDGYVYRIAGGAPIYVSDWSVFGGGQPTSELNNAQFAALRKYPADGTFISGVQTGEVYKIAGGAPTYVTYGWWQTLGSQSVVAVDQNAIANAGMPEPWSHLRVYPEDGTWVRGAPSDAIYRMAGGAPLYVSFAWWQTFAAPPAVVAIDQSAIDNAGGESPWNHVRQTPEGDLFLNAQPTGRIYRVVGGHAYYVPSWEPYGGVQPHLDVDQYAIDHCLHLDCSPFGYLDAVTTRPGGVDVAGWAMDPETTDPLSIRVYVDDAVAAEINGASPRPDVEAVYHREQTAVGFGAPIWMPAGPHEVCVRAVNLLGGNADTLLGCVSATAGPRTRPSLTIHASADQVRTDRPVTFSGAFQVGEGKSGVHLDLRRRALGTTRWAKLASTATGPNGSYQFTQRVRATASYRVTFAGGRSWSVAKSPIVRVAVGR